MNEASRSKRSKEILKLMDEIDSVWNCSGVDDSTIEKILANHNANENDSGEEGYFTGMSDSDIKKSWKEIQAELQNNYSKGRDMDLKLIKVFGLKNKMTKSDFKAKFSKIQAKDNAFSEGYCEAVTDIISAYNIKL